MILEKLGWQLENSYAELPALMFRHGWPKDFADPELVIFNEGLSEELGLNLEGLSEEDIVALFSGKNLPPMMSPIAQAYAGHQFGHFTMLGDGRALLLGEHRTPAGDLMDIQWKGSGPTPYSRNGDGLAALGPMLREYVISEAMHGLGIKTTRSLAVLTTGDPVYRESILPGAVLTRVASSHIRVGTFEFVASQRNKDLLTQMVSYVINRHYPDLAEADNPALSLLDQMIEQQVALITSWLRVGFIHGVMNTDNMTLSGETIDYGPCAFLDHYDHYQVFSSIDRQGRYAYGNQPIIGQWNLARFAEAILPLLHENQEEAIDIAEEHIQAVREKFDQAWLEMMAAKIGLKDHKAGDKTRIMWLLEWMQTNKQDFTNSFRKLSNFEKLSNDPEFLDWYQDWKNRLHEQDMSLDEISTFMKMQNPAIIPRNHKVEEALTAASEKGDLQPFHALLEALKNPYDDREADNPYTQPAPDGGKHYQTFCGT